MIYAIVSWVISRDQLAGCPVAGAVAEEGQYLFGCPPYLIAVKGEAFPRIRLNSVPVAILKTNLRPLGDPFVLMIIL